MARLVVERQRSAGGGPRRRPAAGPYVGDRKTIEHPLVGDIALDVEVLMPAGTDLRIITYAAAAETTDAEKMDALRAACHLPRNGPARPDAETSSLDRGR
ncbi:hypothetical protein [Streptomyces mirabilis]|uniref:hypothetical protein n=1 Tax=Streptomyces mirabilis TaxID=68239 RepID=UPI0033302C14